MVFLLSPLKLLGIILLCEGIDGFSAGLKPFDRFMIKHFFMLLIAISLISNPTYANPKFITFLGVYFLLMFLLQIPNTYAFLKMKVEEFPFNPVNAIKILVGVYVIFFA